MPFQSGQYKSGARNSYWPFLRRGTLFFGFTRTFLKLFLLYPKPQILQFSIDSLYVFKSIYSSPFFFYLHQWAPCISKSEKKNIIIHISNWYWVINNLRFIINEPSHCDYVKAIYFSFSLVFFNILASGRAHERRLAQKDVNLNWTDPNWLISTRN